MAQIQNTITLENNMSETLLLIQEQVTELISIFGDLTASVDSFSESMELMGLYADDVKSAFSGITESVLETNIEIDNMGLAFETAKEMSDSLRESTYSVKVGVDYVNASVDDLKSNIEGLTEQIQGLKDPFDKTQDPIERSNKSTTNLSNTLKNTTRQASSLAKALGVNPQIIKLSTTAMNGFGAATKSALGPLGLILIAVQAIITVVNLLKDSAKDESEGLDKQVDILGEIVSKRDQLRKKVEDLKKPLEDNIIYINRMNELGASRNFIKRLEEENELLGIQIGTLNTREKIQVGLSIEEASKRATELLKEQTVTLHYMQRNRHGYITGIVDDIRIVPSELKQAMIDARKAIESGDPFGEAAKQIDVYLEEVMSIADVLRNTFADQETVAALDEWVEKINALYSSIGTTVEEINQAEIISREKNIESLADYLDILKSKAIPGYQDIIKEAETLFYWNTKIDGVNAEMVYNLDELTDRENALAEAIIKAEQEWNNTLAVTKKVSLANTALISEFNDLVDQLNKLDSTLPENKKKFEDLTDQIRKLEQQIRTTNAIFDLQTKVQRGVYSTGRDVFAVAEKITSAHKSMSAALDAVNNKQGLSLEMYTELMNLSPYVLQGLFDEEGKLLDVEAAVDAVTQSYIDQQAVKQVMIVLEDAMAYALDNGESELQGYSIALKTATTNTWGLVDATMELLSVMGGFEDTGITSYVEMMKNINVSARQRAREAGGLERIEVENASGKALKVNGTVEIKGEMIKLMEDMATRRFMGGSYQNRSSISNNSPITQNIYAAPNMNENDLAKKAGLLAAEYVSDQMLSVFDNRLS